MTPLAAICRGDSIAIPAALRGEQSGFTRTGILTIIIGCALYGAAVGIWRAPLQATYLAFKFPALIFLTLLFNGLLNGMLAQVLGAGLTFRQTFLAIVMSFATFAAVLGALSPVALFLALGAPEPSASDMGAYRRFVLIHTALIAYAGIVANLQMFRTLTCFSSRSAAVRTFIAWSAGNLFVGAQLAWNLRPFFGSPWGEIRFLRPDALEGNFYESVFTMLIRFLLVPGIATVFSLAILTTCLIAIGTLVANAIRKNPPAPRGHPGTPSPSSAPEGSANPHHTRSV